MTRVRIVGILLLAMSATPPAWAQTTNQLFMTGTGSGGAPVLSTSGVDTNINLAIMPKGTGNVGIGTSTPAFALDVRTNTGSDTNVYFVNTGTAGSFANIWAQGNNYAAINFIGSAQQWEAGQIGSNNFKIHDFTNNTDPLTIVPTAPTNSLYITAAGSVGIGTTAPSSLLHIYNASSIVAGAQIQSHYNNIGSVASLTLASDYTNASYIDIFGAGSSHWQMGENGSTSFIISDQAGPTVPFTIVKGAPNNSLYITSTGSVGIGTGSPAAGAQLDVEKTTAGNTGYAGYFANTATTANWGIYSTTATKGAGYGVYSTVTAHSNTGYAGYFSNTDTSTNVNYGIYASTPGVNGWAGYFAGNIGLTGAITMSSDRRLKKDIVSINPVAALDEIAVLRPVSFTWKKNHKPDMGLIAQEVDEVFPDLVVHSPDHSLALKYISLMAPIIASIQELKKRNDEIEAENAALRQEFEDYKGTHP